MDLYSREQRTNRGEEGMTEKAHLNCTPEAKENRKSGEIVNLQNPLPVTPNNPITSLKQTTK